MTPLLLGLSLAAGAAPVAPAEAVEPHVADGFDAYVLGEDYDEPERAVRWLLAHRDDDPTSAKNLWRALRLLSSLPAWRSPALPAQVEAWAAAHPEAEDVAVARLYAAYAATRSPTSWSSPLSLSLSERGWCAEAAGLLAELPSSPRARVAVLDHRVRLAEACGQPAGPARAELDAYRATGEAGPAEQIYAAVVDGVDEPDLALLDAAVAEPRMVWNLAYLARPTTQGPAAPAARERLLAAARALVGSDRLGSVDAARSVFHAAEARDEERQALERLLTFLPDNRALAGRLERLDAAPAPEAPEAEVAEEAPPATTVVNPEARCAALHAAGVPRDAFDARTHWAALADCAAETGDLATATDARERLWRLGGGAAAFGEAALRSGTRVKPAWKAVDAAVDAELADGGYSLAEDAAEWRGRLAHLLVVRADLAAALGGSPAGDLALALRLDGPAPDRLLRLGLAAHDGARDLGGEAAEREEARAATLLGRALATLPGDDPRAGAVREILAEILAQSPGWSADVDTYVAGSAPPPEPAGPAEPALPQPDLGGFVVALGEADRELLSLEGPLVVDLWATWCGPCMQSLPHLDTLARRYAGRATFVALSVDDDRAKADRYLARRGDFAFTSAWSAEGRAHFGVDGIPATFVFDGDHRVVAAFLGWGPGDTRLDDALEDLLGP